MCTSASILLVCDHMKLQMAQPVPRSIRVLPLRQKLTHKNAGEDLCSQTNNCISLAIEDVPSLSTLSLI